MVQDCGQLLKKELDFLLKNKSEVKQVNYIRYDNAGEHELLKKYCDKKGVKL